jgi:HlyD family secretion protein
VVTYKVIVSLTNPGSVIMPGMTANVEIIIDQKRDVLAIQERALMFRPSKEVWESFKLKWTDELANMNRPRTRGPEMMLSSQAPHGQTPSRNPNQAPQAPKVNVWVLEDGQPKQVSIETGISDGSFIQVISGLSEGQEVITGVIQPMMNQQSPTSAFGGGAGGMRVRGF